MVTKKSSELFNQLFEGLNAQEILNMVPSPIFMKDRESVYIGSNQAAKDLFQTELEGRTDFDMPWKEEAETFRANDKIAMDSKKSRIFIEKIIQPNGKVRRFSTMKGPLFDKSGNVVGIIGIPNEILET